MNTRLARNAILGLLLVLSLGVEECDLGLVSIDSPADGTTFTEAQTVTITASALEGEGLMVEQMRFYRDDVLVGSDRFAPYAHAWSITDRDDGTHRFHAEALYRRADGTTELLQSEEVTYEVAINSREPDRPVPGTGELSDLGPINAIALDEDRGIALVTTTQLGLVFVDVRDVRRPSILGTMAFERPVGGLELSRSFAYVRGSGREPGSTSFYVIDIQSPASPALRGQLELPGNGSDVVVNGDIVYVGTANRTDPRGGLHIVDVANPSRPVLLSTFSTWAGRVAAIEDGLVLAMRSAVEMTVVDVTDPRRPRAVVEKGTAWSNALVAGNLLFGLDRVSLWIIEYSGNLDNWHLSSKLPIYPLDLEVQGDLAFVTTMQRTYYPVRGYEHSIVVIDIRDPRNPVTLESLSTEAEVSAIAADGPLVAAGGRDGTLVVIRR